MRSKLGTAVLGALATASWTQAGVSNYVLSGPSASYSSTTDSTSLTAEGGTLSSSGYVFAANQGLTLTNSVTNNYSMLITFELDSTSGYRKLIDFKDKTVDAGLYNLNNQLDFYPIAAGTGTAGAGTTIEPGVLTTVVLNRDSTTQTVTGYVNGVQEIQFNDSAGDATFTGTNGIIRFFEDDTATGTNEASSGSATHIEISTSSTAFTPEPGLAIGIVALGLLCRRRSSRRTA